MRLRRRGRTVNTNYGGNRLLSDWFDRKFRPSLAFDAGRLMFQNINGPLNLAPLYQSRNPVPPSLQGYVASPNVPILPPPVDPGNDDQTFNYNTFILGEPGAAGPGGNPGPAGGPGPQGPPGDPGADVCTCDVVVTSTATYLNTATCRVSEDVEISQDDTGGAVPYTISTSANVDSKITIEATHSATSTFPPGTISGTISLTGLDSFGGSDYDAGVRQSSSSTWSRREELSGQTGQSFLPFQEDGLMLPFGTNCAVPACAFPGGDANFEEVFDTGETFTANATRELTTTGYVDTGTYERTEAFCDDATPDPAPVAATTTIAPPLVCNGGPGAFADSDVPLVFITPPTCCSTCEGQGSPDDGDLSLTRQDILDDTVLDSYCLWDYPGDPVLPTSVVNTGASVSVTFLNEVGSYQFEVTGTYSFRDEVVIDTSIPEDGYSETRTRACTWFGNLNYSVSVTVALGGSA